MAYLTISIEFANPNVAAGHIKDSRVSYTTRNEAFPNNFVLYPGRWVGENSRGTFNALPNMIVEDSLEELSIDYGIKYFSALDFKTFSFKIVDDGTYKFLTKNQNLTGRVLIEYTTETSGQFDSSYTIALLDLYSVTYNNGIVNFECDSVSSWDDNSDSNTKFYGDIQNKELPVTTTETLKIYNAPIPVRRVADARFPDVYFYSPPNQPFPDLATYYEAHKTRYTKSANNSWVMYLDIVDNPRDKSQDLLRSYIGKFIKVSIVDGKGSGDSYYGTLIQTYDIGITAIGYAVEFDLSKSEGPELENVTKPDGIVVLDKPITISKIDISTHVELLLDYVVYDIGDLTEAEISDITIETENGEFTSIPKSVIIFEDGKIKMPSEYKLSYKVAIPLRLEDFTTSVISKTGYLYNGDMASPVGTSQPISITQADSIINDHNTDTFVSTVMNTDYNVGSYLFYTFSIGDENSNLSIYKNASRYVLNGKIEVAAVYGSPNLTMKYRWFDNDEIGNNIPFEYSEENTPVDYPIKTFSTASNKWYTLNRYVINQTYTGNVSGGENYLVDKIELDINESSDDLRTLGLFMFQTGNFIQDVRLYDISICAEFEYTLSKSNKIFISLKDTHPGHEITDISQIITNQYGLHNSYSTVISPFLGNASSIISSKNIRKTLTELISETPCSFSESVTTDIINSDIFYYPLLKSFYTQAQTSFDTINLPIIDIKSVSVNDEWYNTIKITSGDNYYNLGKKDEPLRDTNSSWTILSNKNYNEKTKESFDNNGVIKVIEKELKYINDPNSFVSLANYPSAGIWSFVKQYRCKFTAPLNIDILYYLWGTFVNSLFIKTSHPALFDNSIVTMRINKIDINFQEQLVDLVCDIFDIQPNPDDVDFTLWFDSPFQDYPDKIQDNMSNGNDGDWYVGIL